jgi:hypothetical protein
MSQSWNYFNPETKIEIEVTAKRPTARSPFPHR